jgi:hypothetical protein
MTDDNETQGGINAKIVVSGKAEIEKLEKELEAERIEKEDLASKLEMIAEKQFSIAREKAGAPVEIDSPEKLEAWKLAKEGKTQNPHLNPELGTGGSGKAPLSGEPSGQISTVKEYPDVASMMRDLQERSMSSNKAVAEEAEQIIAQLHKKQAESKKSHEFEIEIPIGSIGKEKREKGEKIYEEITKNSRGSQQ